MEVDAKRAILSEALDHADVAGRDGRRIDAAEAGREGVAIAAVQFARLLRRMHERESVGQAVAPGADDLADLALQLGARDLDRRAA